MKKTLLKIADRGLSAAVCATALPFFVAVKAGSTIADIAHGLKPESERRQTIAKLVHSLDHRMTVSCVEMLRHGYIGTYCRMGDESFVQRQAEASTDLSMLMVKLFHGDDHPLDRDEFMALNLDLHRKMHTGFKELKDNLKREIEKRPTSWWPHFETSLRAAFSERKKQWEEEAVNELTARMGGSLGQA